MNGTGESDRPIIPRKLSNKGAAAAVPAERAEGRGLAKENLLRQNQPIGHRAAPGWQNALERIRQAARKDKEARFTALWHHVANVQCLREEYFALKRNSAPGVDGQTWRQYGQDLEANLQDLSGRLHRGAYHAKPVQRVYIPKPDGRQRPIGIPTLEDKLVQRAAVKVLSAVYETDFMGFSYGFRPNRGCHDALDALAVGISERKVNWVLDADIRGFLETSTYCTPVYEGASKRPGWLSITLIRKPLRLPRRTCTALSSPRFTRCNTVWRETPSRRVASSIGM